MEKSIFIAKDHFLIFEWCHFDPPALWISLLLGSLLLHTSAFLPQLPKRLTEERSPKESLSGAPIFPNPSSEPKIPPPLYSGGGLIANIDQPRLTIANRDIPTKLAKAKQKRRIFPSIDYLQPLGIKIEENVVLEVIVVIEATGKPTVYPELTQVLQGNLTAEEAGKLAKEIIERWKFQPTYMGSQPVAQEYFIRVQTNFIGK